LGTSSATPLDWCDGCESNGEADSIVIFGGFVGRVSDQQKNPSFATEKCFFFEIF
jgi:hypothetical protein